MSTLEPLATVLVVSAASALTASLGVVPRALGRHPGGAVVGWANALAAGLMIGVAYVLLTEGVRGSIGATGLGVLLGLAVVRGLHAAAGTGELDAEDAESGGPETLRKAVLVDSLHAADEGIAIGVAMSVSMPLGIAMAATLAVHNVPEAFVLSRILESQGVRIGRSALLAVGVNAGQIALAGVAFVVVEALASLEPWIAGFAVAALMYRTLVELLPEAYHQAGKTIIAMVTLLAIGIVVLLAGVAA